MKNPLLSIVITNYNYDRFLAQAIESALAQSYANTEVLVVDAQAQETAAAADLQQGSAATTPPQVLEPEPPAGAAPPDEDVEGLPADEDVRASAPIPSSDVAHAHPLDAGTFLRPAAPARRGSRRADLAARLKSRIRALRARLDHRALFDGPGGEDSAAFPLDIDEFEQTLFGHDDFGFHGRQTLRLERRTGAATATVASLLSDSLTDL